MLMYMKGVKKRYLKMNKIYVGWKDIEELVDDLCHYINTDLPEIKYIHGLSRGGLIPAVMLSHTLKIPYTNNPELFAPWQVLIVDDIADSGETLEKWIEYPTAVLHYKPHTSCIEPSIHAYRHIGDEWVIYPWERDDSEPIQDYKL